MNIVLIAISAAIAFFVAWNNGANNAADAIGTAVGSRALSLRKALIVTAIADFVGAMLFGSFVSETIMRGIVDVSLIKNPNIIICGMLASLLATGLWMFLASFMKIPMSISMAIVGSVMGFGITAIGVGGVQWVTITYIFISWAILPISSAAVALVLNKFYEGMFRKLRLIPYVGASSLFLVIFSASFLLLYGKVYRDYIEALMTSVILSISSALIFVSISKYIIRNSKSESEARGKLLRILILIAAATIAFSHGSNDVAKSAGPLTAIIVASMKGYIPATVTVNPYALSFCALGIAIGILSWGYRVVGTVGEEITTLTYTSAFTAQISASIPLLIFTRLGMPVSTTMSVVGAIAGVGLAKGIKYVNLRTLIKIFGMWIVAVPITTGISALIYILMSFACLH